MFSAVAMQRLSIVVLDRDEHLVLRSLGRLGVIHLLRAKAGPETAPREPPDRSVEMAACDELLGRVETMRRRLESDVIPEPAAEPQPVSMKEIDNALSVMESRATDLLARRQTFRKEHDQAVDVLEQITAYEGLKLPMDQFGQAAFLHFATGSLPAEKIETLQEEVGPNVLVFPLKEHKKRRHVIAVTSRTGRFALQTALEKSDFRADTITVPPGKTAEEQAEISRRDESRIRQEREEAEGAVDAMVAEVAPILAAFRCLVQIERQVLDAEQNFPRTESTVFITGWSPKEDVPRVRRYLQEQTAGRCVVEAADPEGIPETEIPILLRHPRLLRPFQMLVGNFGLPNYRELEPTFFVAISYVIMFSMMFGDAGQGAVLALLGLGVIIKGRSEQARDAGLLVLILGLASVVSGVIYGSYFGIPHFKEYAIWHDPLEGDPMGLMYAAISLGIFVISLGLVLNIVNRFRRRDFVGGLFDKFGVIGAVFYWGVLLLLLKYTWFKESGLTGAMAIGVIAVPLAILAVKEPILYFIHKRSGHGGHPGANLFESIIESIIEAYDTVLVYLSNTISFVRLAAYAMSHAAILLAAFVVAEQVQNALPGVAGGAGSVVVVILGNLVAILLEGVVVGVQGLRLEYYEFFGKFFSANGHAFKPFTFQSRDQGLLPQG